MLEKYLQTNHTNCDKDTQLIDNLNLTNTY